MSDDKQVEKRKEKLAGGEIAVAEKGMQLKTGEDYYAFAQWAIHSGMVPSCFKKPAQVFVALQTGAEVGMTPMQSVRSVYVVNGAPAWTTKAARALVRSSGMLNPRTDIDEGVTHIGHKPGEKCTDDCCGWCKTWRVGTREPKTTRFSVRDAKKASLWTKTGPWQQYPDRMLMHRATGFHLDDNFGDVLMGLTTVEVVRDWPQSAFSPDRDATERLGTPPQDPLLSGGSTPESPAANANEDPAIEPASNGEDPSPETCGGEQSQEDVGDSGFRLTPPETEDVEYEES